MSSSIGKLFFSIIAHNNLVQLIFRQRFNPDNHIQTTAIDTLRNEIYLFRHETVPSYENTRG